MSKPQHNGVIQRLHLHQPGAGKSEKTTFVWSRANTAKERDRAQKQPKGGGRSRAYLRSATSPGAAAGPGRALRAQGGMGERGGGAGAAPCPATPSQPRSLLSWSPPATPGHPRPSPVTPGHPQSPPVSHGHPQSLISWSPPAIPSQLHSSPGHPRSLPASPGRPPAPAPLTIRVLLRRPSRLPAGLPRSRRGSGGGSRLSRGLLRDESSERSRGGIRASPDPPSRHSPAGK